LLLDVQIVLAKQLFSSDNDYISQVPRVSSGIYDMIYVLCLHNLNIIRV